jgi:hypothetical protein
MLFSLNMLFDNLLTLFSKSIYFFFPRCFLSPMDFALFYGALWNLFIQFTRFCFIRTVWRRFLQAVLSVFGTGSFNSVFLVLYYHK